LQAEVSARVSGFTNVMFYGVAVSSSSFSHRKITTVISFSGLLVMFPWLAVEKVQKHK